MRWTGNIRSDTDGRPKATLIGSVFHLGDQDSDDAAVLCPYIGTVRPYIYELLHELHEGVARRYKPIWMYKLLFGPLSLEQLDKRRPGNTGRL